MSARLLCDSTSDGNFMFDGNRYPFRVSRGWTNGNGHATHSRIDPGQRPISATLDGI